LRVLIEQPSATAAGPRRKWLWIGAAVLVAIIVAGATILTANWPFTRENVRKALEEASGRPVEIRTFSSSYFPPGCTAEGVRFLRHKHPSLTPIITIERLAIQGSFTGLFRSPKRLTAVRIVGMHLIVASKKRDEGPEHVALNSGPGGKALTIAKITADGAVLEFKRAGSNEAPFVLKVDKLALTDVGSGAPMHYRAELTNSVPPGVIWAEGKFGPWRPGDIGATPVSGTYSYDKIDLRHFRSIYGVGKARGEFSGPIARIRTRGRVEVAGFGVEGSGHTTPLTADYDATVNGTNGDVLLDPAVATFQHTRVEVRGWVSEQAGERGKTATFDLAVPQGRVDDLLALFDSGQPEMSGPVTLQGKFVWPPGPSAFLRKIRMDLSFGIERGRFTSANTQGSIDRLSESAEGEKRSEIEEDPRTVLLDLRGGIRVRNGVAAISDGKMQVPGADATVQGTYGLMDKRLKLKGTLDTRGDISEETSGIKAWLLKAMTPLFKKRGRERIIPFEITGSDGKTTVSIDWKRRL
jgi:AsmA-like C-terminal region